jgi:hypothetical protein
MSLSSYTFFYSSLLVFFLLNSSFDTQNITSNNRRTHFLLLFNVLFRSTFLHFSSLLLIPLKAVTDLVDSSLPSICHSQPLPCAITDTDTAIHPSNRIITKDREREREAEGRSCLSPPLLLGLLREADREFCLRYTGDKGGRNATLLSTYSFMKEVINVTITLTSSSSSFLFSFFIYFLFFFYTPRLLHG